MSYTILRDGGELYLLNYPIGIDPEAVENCNGTVVNITTVLTTEACERVRKQAQEHDGNIFEVGL